MGKANVIYIEHKENLHIFAGLQHEPEKDELFPIFNQFNQLSENIEAQSIKPDVIVNFSTPRITSELLGLSNQHQLAIVLATTGQTAD